MDQGLKERLVGAAVLVAIGVWLIPWVLDGPETPLDTGASSLQLPAAEEPVPMRTQTLRLGADAESEPAPPVPATSEPATAAAAADSPADPPEEPAAASVEAPVAAAEPVPVRAPESRAAAVAPPKPAPPASAAGAKGAWVVQLGSFGEEANARRQAQLAATYGYKAAVSSIRSNGRTLYRVRVGPLETRGAADAAASALAGHGVRPATVVAAD